MTITVRAATCADFAQVHALYKDLVGDTPVPDGADGQAQFATVLSHPGTSIFLAERQGRARAMVTLHLLPNMTFAARPYALIENVVTAHGYHGQGLGRAVMTHAADVAWAANAYKIMLLTGQTAGARGFYERLGYRADEKFGMTLRRAPPRRVAPP